MTVGSNDDVALSCHNHEVPTVAPELRNGALRSTFAEEQGGVLLIRVEVRRFDNPVVHVLASSCLYPTGFTASCCNLVEDVVVLMSNLRELYYSITEHICEIEVGRVHVVVTLQEKSSALFVSLCGGSSRCILFFSGYKCQRTKVGLIVRELLYVAFEVCAIEILRCVPYSEEVDGLGIGSPNKVVNIRVEGFCYILLLACCQFINAKTQTVGFISVALHTCPSKILAIG